MGLDVFSSVWVGVKFDDGEAGTFTNTQLPETISNSLWDEGEVTEDGLKFTFFRFSDTEVGFGVEVFTADLDDGVVDFNLGDLFRREQEFLPRVVSCFKKWGVSSEPKTFFTMNIS